MDHQESHRTQGPGTTVTANWEETPRRGGWPGLRAGWSPSALPAATACDIHVGTAAASLAKRGHTALPLHWKQPPVQTTAETPGTAPGPGSTACREPQGFRLQGEARRGLVPLESQLESGGQHGEPGGRPPVRTEELAD